MNNELTMTHPMPRSDPGFLAYLKPILLKRKSEAGSGKHRVIINAVWRINYNLKKRGLL
tara:strand:+ start:308 stop:484 length:177 start_codon:yes stop_codon:yes gene_type:complete